MMKISIYILLSLVLIGCSSILNFEESLQEPQVHERQYETPYNRYLRHHLYFEGVPGQCRHCKAETYDLEVAICEDCYYRINKINNKLIQVEPLQFNERFYIEPAYKSYSNTISQSYYLN